MPRPRARYVPPLFGKRELAQLFFLFGFFVIVIVAMIRVREPGTWRWLEQLEPVDSQVAEPAPPPSGFANVQPSQPPPKDAPRDERSAPEEVPAKSPADAREAPAGPDAAPRKAADVNSPPSPESPVMETSPEMDIPATLQREAEFNPLKLVQTNECGEVNKYLLRGVKDDIDPRTKRRFDRDEIAANNRMSMPSLYQLLCVASCTPPNRLRQQARPKAVLPSLWSDPEAYRGKVIHIDGVVASIAFEGEELDERKPNPYGIDTIYRAWVFIPELERHVLVLFTKLPEGMEPALDLKENISLDAFFFKLYAYKARDEKWRAVPMLLAYEPRWIKVDVSPIVREAMYWIGGLIAVFLVALGAFWWRARKDEQFAQELRKRLGEPPRPAADFLSAGHPTAEEAPPS